MENNHRTWNLRLNSSGDAYDPDLDYGDESIEVVFVIEYSAFEQLQKRVEELEKALSLSGNACGVAATFLEFHGTKSKELNNCVKLMENHEKMALETLGDDENGL